MSLDSARAVADAVLWEGYLLYPYRATSAKNRIRWQFGVLGPSSGAATAAGVAEDPAMHVECLLRASDEARVEVRMRFLHLVRRQVHQVGPEGVRPVDELQVEGHMLLSFDEAVDRELSFGPFCVDELRSGLAMPIEVPQSVEIQDLRGVTGSVDALVERHRQPLSGLLNLRAEDIEAPTAERWLRLVIDVRNEHAQPIADRDAATAVSFLGAHLLLEVRDGTFASLLEPPSGLDTAAGQCRQHRCWPVLAGSPGAEGVSEIVLASPIILYDHPAVAPESAGALFDSTEIDEILTLRVMTLTDEEKAAARATDPAAAAIIDRCDNMSVEDLARLHGALRDPRAAVGAAEGQWSPLGAGSGNGSVRRSADQPWGPADLDLSEVPVFGEPASDPAGQRLDGNAEKPWWDPGVDASVSPTTDTVVVDGVKVGAGTIVRIRPQRRADAQDLFYAGQTARVVSVYSDVDDHCHVAVVLTDDPAADLHEWYGRYLYFSPDELEPVAPAGKRPAAGPETIVVPDTTVVPIFAFETGSVPETSVAPETSVVPVSSQIKEHQP